jgi:hypothetical protein
MDDRERVGIEMLEIDHRRINRMVWRRHPMFAFRFAMASRFTVDGFWLPLANALGCCTGYGAYTSEGSTRPGPRP